MALQPGVRLGPYEIHSAIGAGGMGEVWRARDTTLGRDVALKILPDHLALDPDRLARFKREAHILASLNHPNIATIHGFQEFDGVQALVLELVEGPTLADRIAQGSIPVDEALPIAKQITEALEAAHELGIIHRDLKPANIKLRADGTVKVLDFGLAKAIEATIALAPSGLSQSPTITSPAPTHVGVLLGTAAYMSPEQARGKTVDKRTDIWAFGCVLYEMLTSRASFPGEDVSEVLASVLKTPVNLDLLPEPLHRNVREVLSRCLDKDPRKRFRDMGDVRYELEKALDDPRGASMALPTSAAHLSRILPWIAIAALTSGVVVGMAVWYLKPAVAALPDRIVRFDYTLPEGQSLAGLGQSTIALSPDGRHFVYRTNKGLYLRAMDESTAKLIPGTEAGGANAFFSPDGQSIGFFAEDQLKKTSTVGGPPVTLSAAPDAFGASWGTDNKIVFDSPEGIMRVSADGGMPELLVSTEAGERAQGPQMLPRGRWVLFTLARGNGSDRWDKAEIVAHSLESGERKVVWSGGSDARYVPTGHLIYSAGTDLFAVRFDLDRLEASGGQVPVVSDVPRVINPAIGGAAAHYSFSDDGTLIHVVGVSVARQARSLVWVDRQGTATPIIQQQGQYRLPRLSPDNRYIAVTINDRGNEDISIIDTARGALTRFTSGSRNIFGLWTRDGTRLAFSSNRAGASKLYWTSVDGSEAVEPLTKSDRDQWGSSWSPDGKLAFLEIGPDTDGDLWVVAPGGDPKPLFVTRFRETGAAFSPDGHWLAYSSNESGREEVYVQRYPGPGGKVPVSIDGGHSPVWSSDGRELFYRNGRRMMVVAVQASPAFRMGVPKLLFEGEYFHGVDGNAQYDVTRDGKRFVMIRLDSDSEVSRPRINIVLHWFEELKRLAPTN